MGACLCYIQACYHLENHMAQLRRVEPFANQCFGLYAALRSLSEYTILILLARPRLSLPSSCY